VAFCPSFNKSAVASMCYKFRMILNNKQVLVYLMKNGPVSLVLPRNKWVGVLNTLTFIIE